MFVICGLYVLVLQYYAISSVEVIPSLSPLKYINLQTISSAFVETSERAVWSTLLPIDQQDAVAIFISEGVAGFLGGAAAKGIALIDGNKNARDSSLVFAEASGAYFGVAGAIKSLAQIAGLSSVSVNILALTFGALISEFIKIRSRSIPKLRTRVGSGPTMYDLMKFKDPSMLDLMKFQKNENTSLPPRMRMMGEITRTEINADLIKFFFIYFFMSSSNNPITQLEDSAVIGVVAGLLSQTVREQRDRELEDQRTIQYRNALEKRKKNQTIQKKVMQAIKGNNEIDLIPKKNKKDWMSNKTIRQLKSYLSRFKMEMGQPSMNETSSANKTELTTDTNGNNMDRPDFVITRFARAGVECAVQLLTYQAAREYVRSVAPYFQTDLPINMLDVDFILSNLK